MTESQARSRPTVDHYNLLIYPPSSPGLSWSVGLVHNRWRPGFPAVPELVAREYVAPGEVGERVQEYLRYIEDRRPVQDALPSV